MKVRELIKQLLEFGMDQEVCVMDTDRDGMGYAVEADTVEAEDVDLPDYGDPVRAVVISR